MVIGDIGADMGSAQAAGARAILVPTLQTRPEEVRAAPAVRSHADRRRRRRAGRTVLTWPVIVLVVRLDSMGDMLAAGPAVRAVAAGADRVTVLCGPAGAPGRLAAARRRRHGGVGVSLDHQPAAGGESAGVDDLIDRIARLGIDQAVILTSFHQSPLPTALLLRLAGVRVDRRGRARTIPARCSTLGCRWPTTHRSRSGCCRPYARPGFALPAGDDGRLRVRRPLPDVDAVLPSAPGAPLVVVHPGTSAPARAYPEPLWAPAVDRLVAGRLAGGADRESPPNSR